MSIPSRRPPRVPERCFLDSHFWMPPFLVPKIEPPKATSSSGVGSWRRASRWCRQLNQSALRDLPVAHFPPTFTPTHGPPPSMQHGLAALRLLRDGSSCFLLKAIVPPSGIDLHLSEKEARMVCVLCVLRTFIRRISFSFSQLLSNQPWLYPKARPIPPTRPSSAGDGAAEISNKHTANLLQNV